MTHSLNRRLLDLDWNFSREERGRIDAAYTAAVAEMDLALARLTRELKAAGVLDEALSTIFRVPVVTRAAGRTDAGVHAAGQVASSPEAMGMSTDFLPRASPARSSSNL